MGNTRSRELHGYTVSGRLGGGCFGTVYKARCRQKVNYAIKEIYRGKSESAVSQLQREVDIHERLPYHRNIVRFIECFRHDFKMYLVLEYCSLGSLNDYVIQHLRTSRKTDGDVRFEGRNGEGDVRSERRIGKGDVRSERSIGKGDVRSDRRIDEGDIRSERKVGNGDVSSRLKVENGDVSSCRRDGALGPERNLDGDEDEERTLLYVMFDLARGLQHLHRHGILHRDIKPDNVLLSPGKFNIPTCKICDFGLARESCKGERETGSGESPIDPPFSDDGPLMYMAPEVTSGHYTTACDVFSLGVLYFALFSRQITEFKGRKLLEPHMNGYPIFMAPMEIIEAETRRYVSGGIESEVVIPMLRKDPKSRVSMKGVLDKLNEAFAHAISKDSRSLENYSWTNGHIQAK